MQRVTTSFGLCHGISLAYPLLQWFSQAWQQSKVTTISALHAAGMFQRLGALHHDSHVVQGAPPMRAEFLCHAARALHVTALRIARQSGVCKFDAGQVAVAEGAETQPPCAHQVRQTRLAGSGRPCPLLHCFGCAQVRADSNNKVMLAASMQRLVRCGAGEQTNSGRVCWLKVRTSEYGPHGRTACKCAFHASCISINRNG